LDFSHAKDFGTISKHSLVIEKRAKHSFYHEERPHHKKQSLALSEKGSKFFSETTIHRDKKSVKYPRVLRRIFYLV
jgi:hypothetical protein